MNKQLNALFSVLIRALTALTVMVLAFVIYFIVKEALPTFDEVAVPGFPVGPEMDAYCLQGSRPLAFLISCGYALRISGGNGPGCDSGDGGRHLSSCVATSGCGESYIPLWTF